MIRTVLHSFSARLFSLPVIAVAGIIGARLVIDGLGTNGYAVYSLVIGMAALLPFADFGVGTALMDTTARTKDFASAQFSKALITSLHILSVAALTLCLIAWILALAGTWSQILGLPSAPGTEIAVASSLTSFAIVLPTTIGPRMLTGLGRNHHTLLLQAAGTVLGIVPIALAYMLQLPLWVYTTSPFLGNTIGNLFALLLVHRNIRLPLNDITFRKVISRVEKNPMLRGIAAPMVIITIILPLAYQTDRVIISHEVGIDAVAQYSMALQLYSPLMSVIGGTAIALWPIFVDRGAGTSAALTFYRSMLIFTTAGTVLAICLVLVGPTIASVISNGAISPGEDLWICFGALLVLQSASYPMAMFLTRSDQLWYQAKLHIIMLSINFPLSLFSARMIGAPGPVIASCIAIAAALSLPQFLRTRRDLALPHPTNRGDKPINITTV